MGKGSHAKTPRRQDDLAAAVDADARIVVDCAFRIHRDLGPGLLESVYERLLCRCLEKAGQSVERQAVVHFDYDGETFDDGLRLDLLVNNRLVVELKSVEAIAHVHSKQVLTYLRLMHLPLGLLINFGGATIKEGIKRIANNMPESSPLAPWRLGVSPKGSQR